MIPKMKKNKDFWKDKKFLDKTDKKPKMPFKQKAKHKGKMYDSEN